MKYDLLYNFEYFSTVMKNKYDMNGNLKQHDAALYTI